MENASIIVQEIKIEFILIIVGMNIFVYQNVKVLIILY